jgi:hypothetical protein
MSNPRFLFASFLVLLAAACGGSTVQPPPNPNDIQGPGDLAGKNVTPPGTPGVAYINVHCEPKVVDCNGQPFDMHVVGDRLDSCRITPDTAAPGTSKVSIQIKNKTDSSQSILVSFDGYTGTGRYQLDDANRRRTSVSQSLSLPTWGPENATCTNGSWSSPPATATHQVGAPDPSCGAGRCEATVTERDPSASPRKLEVHVTCSELCVNNDDVVCRASGGNFVEYDFVADGCTN